MTLFYDAADPDNIPAGARACVYLDGLYAASQRRSNGWARSGTSP